MIRLNKKLWSFNIGCFASWAFMWLGEVNQWLPVPQYVLKNEWFDLNIYYVLTICAAAILMMAVLITIMHHGLNIHTSEHTFWLVFPILIFLILISIFANALIFSMLNAAIPALFIILLVARKKKKRRIFDMKKALS